MSNEALLRRVFDAKDRLVAATLGVLQAELVPPDDPHGGDNLTYATDQLALAARGYVELVNELPVDQWPVGWARPVALAVVR